MVGVAASEHAAFAELEDEQSATRRVKKVRGQRPNAGVLVAEGKTGLALIGRDQIKTLKVGDVAPTACDLAVRDPETALGQRLHQFGDGAAVEKSVAEIREYDRIGRHFLDRPGDLFEYLVGDRTVVERVHLEKPVAPDDDRILVDRRP